MLTDAFPENKSYRQALADSFRTLGRYSAGVITRNFYLAAARSLEGEAVHSLGSVQDEEWVIADLARAINQLRTRIDPQKAAGHEGVLAFDVGGRRLALHVRNSVAEFVSAPERHYRAADAVINAEAQMFARYFRGQLSAAAFVEATGASAQAAVLLGLFDEYRHRPMYA